MVDKDRIEGAGHEAKGKIKKNVGKATGDTGMEVEGEAEELGGKAQNTWGSAKDKARGK